MHQCSELNQVILRQRNPLQFLASIFSFCSDRLSLSLVTAFYNFVIVECAYVSAVAARKQRAERDVSLLFIRRASPERTTAPFSPPRADAKRKERAGRRGCPRLRSAGARTASRANRRRRETFPHLTIP